MAGLLNGRSQTRGRYRPLSEINVTPLVDVMLVLLIIFMVTAPLMTTRRIGRPAENRRPAAEQRQPAAHRIDRRNRQDISAGSGG